MTSKSGETRAQANRRIRQDALREQLKVSGHITQLVDNTRKLQDLEQELDSNQIQRLRASNDTHKYVIDKYLPNLKAIEVSGDPENPIETKWTVEFINASPESK